MGDSTSDSHLTSTSSKKRSSKKKKLNVCNPCIRVHECKMEKGGEFEVKAYFETSKNNCVMFEFRTDDFDLNEITSTFIESDFMIENEREMVGNILLDLISQLRQDPSRLPTVYLRNKGSGGGVTEDPAVDSPVSRPDERPDPSSSSRFSDFSSAVKFTQPSVMGSSSSNVATATIVATPTSTISSKNGGMIAIGGGGVDICEPPPGPPVTPNNSNPESSANEDEFNGNGDGGQGRCAPKKLLVTVISSADQSDPNHKTVVSKGGVPVLIPRTANSPSFTRRTSVPHVSSSQQLYNDSVAMATSTATAAATQTAHHLSLQPHHADSMKKKVLAFNSGVTTEATPGSALANSSQVWSDVRRSIHPVGGVGGASNVISEEGGGLTNVSSPAVDKNLISCVATAAATVGGPQSVTATVTQSGSGKGPSFEALRAQLNSMMPTSMAVVVPSSSGSSAAAAVPTTTTTCVASLTSNGSPKGSSATSFLTSQPPNLMPITTLSPVVSLNAANTVATTTTCAPLVNLVCVTEEQPTNLSVRSTTTCGVQQSTSSSSNTSATDTNSSPGQASQATPTSSHNSKQFRSFADLEINLQSIMSAGKVSGDHQQQQLNPIINGSSEDVKHGDGVSVSNSAQTPSNSPTSSSERGKGLNAPSSSTVTTSPSSFGHAHHQHDLSAGGGGASNPPCLLDCKHFQTSCAPAPTDLILHHHQRTNDPLKFDQPSNAQQMTVNGCLDNVALRASPRSFVLRGEVSSLGRPLTPGGAVTGLDLTVATRSQENNKIIAGDEISSNSTCEQKYQTSEIISDYLLLRPPHETVVREGRFTITSRTETPESIGGQHIAVDYTSCFKHQYESSESNVCKRSLSGGMATTMTDPPPPRIMDGELNSLMQRGGGGSISPRSNRPPPPPLLTGVGAAAAAISSGVEQSGLVQGVQSNLRHHHLESNYNSLQQECQAAMHLRAERDQLIRASPFMRRRVVAGAAGAILSNSASPVSYCRGEIGVGTSQPNMDEILAPRNSTVAKPSLPILTVGTAGNARCIESPTSISEEISRLDENHRQILQEMVRQIETVQIDYTTQRQNLSVKLMNAVRANEVVTQLPSALGRAISQNNLQQQRPPPPIQQLRNERESEGKSSSGIGETVGVLTTCGEENNPSSMSPHLDIRRVNNGVELSRVGVILSERRRENSADECLHSRNTLASVASSKKVKSGASSSSTIPLEVGESSSTWGTAAPPLSKPLAFQAPPPSDSILPSSSLFDMDLGRRVASPMNVFVGGQPVVDTSSTVNQDMCVQTPTNHQQVPACGGGGLLFHNSTGGCAGHDMFNSGAGVQHTSNVSSTAAASNPSNPYDNLSASSPYQRCFAGMSGRSIGSSAVHHHQSKNASVGYERARERFSPYQNRESNKPMISHHSAAHMSNGLRDSNSASKIGGFGSRTASIPHLDTSYLHGFSMPSGTFLPSTSTLAPPPPPPSSSINKRYFPYNIGSNARISSVGGSNSHQIMSPSVDFSSRSNEIVDCCGSTSTFSSVIRGNHFNGNFNDLNLNSNCQSHHFYNGSGINTNSHLLGHDNFMSVRVPSDTYLSSHGFNYPYIPPSSMGSIGVGGCGGSFSATDKFPPWSGGFSIPSFCSQNTVGGVGFSSAAPPPPPVGVCRNTCGGIAPNSSMMPQSLVPTGAGCTYMDHHLSTASACCGSSHDNRSDLIEMKSSGDPSSTFLLSPPNAFSSSSGGATSHHSGISSKHSPSSDKFLVTATTTEI